MTEDALSLRPGTRLGKCTIVRRIAVGGMAELYLARIDGPAGFEKRCVVKRVRPVLANERDFVGMFLREARLAARLDHPAIVQVLDIGQADGEDFIVMEYVHGANVRELLRTASLEGLPRDVALNIVWGAARGLHHAHHARGPDGRPLGIVHRDISPANILVSFDGDVKIVDFGIAKALSETRATHTNAFMGKIGYMAPEQCKGTAVDGRTDVFSLGVVLYECTIGTRPFHAESQFAVMNQIVEGRYARPHEVAADYPPELEAIVERALQVDPDDRHPTAEALQLEIEAAMEQLGLRRSPSVLADHMRGAFGDRTLPDVTLTPSDAPGGTAPAVRPRVVEIGGRETAAPARAVGSYVRGGVMLVAVAGVAWWVGAQGRSGDAPTPSAAPAQAVQVAEPDPTPPPPEPDPEPPQASPTPQPPPPPAPTGDVEEEEPEPAEPDAPPKPASKRARRGKRTKRRAPSGDDAPRLFPRAYYDSDG